MNLTKKNHLLAIQRELRQLYKKSKNLSESIKELENRVESMRETREESCSIFCLKITRKRKADEDNMNTSTFTINLDSMPRPEMITNHSENMYATPFDNYGLTNLLSNKDSH